MLENYRKVILGDREFCSVGLARWLNEQKKTYYCLRLKKTTFIEVDKEMFRDFKSGGYDFERTKLTEKRLMSLIILITLAYTQAILSGKIIKDKGIAKYVGRVKEKNRIQKRHSDFYLSLQRKSWVESLQLFAVESEELMKLSPKNKANYQQGMRAVLHIKSSL